MKRNSKMFLFIVMLLLTGRRCVVMHDAPSFLFITDINRFIFFKLR